MRKIISILLFTLVLCSCGVSVNGQPDVGSVTSTVSKPKSEPKIGLVPHTLTELGYRFACPDELEGVNAYVPEVDMGVYQLYNSYQIWESNPISGTMEHGTDCLFGDYMILKPNFTYRYNNSKEDLSFALLQAYFRSDVEQGDVYFWFNKTKDHMGVKKLTLQEAEPYLIYHDDTIVVYDFFSVTDAPPLETQLEDFWKKYNYYAHHVSYDQFLKIRDYFSPKKLGQYIKKDSSSVPLDPNDFLYNPSITMPKMDTTEMSCHFHSENGLSIEFSYDWSGRYSVETANVPKTDNVSYLKFNLANSGPTLFTVYSFKKEDFAKLSHTETKKYGTYLGSNDKFSFTFLPQQLKNPFSPTSDDALIFNKMLWEIRSLERFVKIDFSSPNQDRMPTTGIPSSWLRGDYYIDQSEQFTYPHDAVAKRLAGNIARTFVATGNPVFTDFNGPQQASSTEMLAVALFHAPEILYSDTPNERIQNIIDTAQSIGLQNNHLYYGEDVRAVAAIIFGKDTILEMQNSGGYYYFADQDMYLMPGDYGGPVVPYPQVVFYQKTENGYICDIMITHKFFNCFIYDDSLEHLLEIPINAKNIAWISEWQPHYRYTFEEEDGRLILTGFVRL